MDETDWLSTEFEAQRDRLRAVAYRMLGSVSEAEDAVQDAWLRLSKTNSAEIDNLAGWLTTVVARVSLNALRARNVRRSASLEAHLPDPIVLPAADLQPEEETVLADSVGLALLVVLDTLTPAERLAFVLHDMFDLPFEEIAPMLDRSVIAVRQLASRGRRRVQGASVPSGDTDVVRQRKVVDAFYAAARQGDFDGLVGVLDPDVVLRADFGPRRRAESEVVRGAAVVAGRAMIGARLDTELHPALVNGSAGAVVTLDGEPFALMGFTVVDDKIVEIDIYADPERVGRIAAPFLGSDTNSHNGADAPRR